MNNHRVIVDMVFEDEAGLEDAIGTHFIDGTTERQVDVAATGTQVGEIVTMSLEGTLPDVLAWMIEAWQDDELALQALTEALQAGRVELM